MDTSNPPQTADWYLFLDDVRPAPCPKWVTARSVAEAQALIAARGIPVLLSFDHDLGDGPSGYVLARWLVEQDLDDVHRLPDGFVFRVHSRNPVGAENIEALLRGYLSFRARH